MQSWARRAAAWGHFTVRMVGAECCRTQTSDVQAVKKIPERIVQQLSTMEWLIGLVEYNCRIISFQHICAHSGVCRTWLPI